MFERERLRSPEGDGDAGLPRYKRNEMLSRRRETISVGVPAVPPLHHTTPSLIDFPDTVFYSRHVTRVFAYVKPEIRICDVITCIAQRER